MNGRKAQKHMQRATELLNQVQFGFGANGEDPKKDKEQVKWFRGHPFPSPIRTGGDFFRCQGQKHYVSIKRRRWVF